MTQSYFESIGRATDAPVDISKTDYLNVEVDSTENVNKNIDDISKKWDEHFAQMSAIWDHIHKKEIRRGGFVGQVAHLLKDDVEEFQQDYKKWDDFAKSYFPYAKALHKEHLEISRKFGIDSDEYRQWKAAAGTNIDGEVQKEFINEENRNLVQTKGHQAAWAVHGSNLELANEFFNGPGGVYADDNERAQDLNDLMTTVYPNWLDYAKDSLKVPITLKDGTIVYKTFNEAAGNWSEQEEILLNINGWFAHFHKDAARGRMGLYKRDVINKMTTQVTAEKLSALKTSTAAFLETSRQAKGEELKVKLQSNPGYPIEWLSSMVGHPSFLDTQGNHSHKLAKQGLTNEIVALIEADAISRKELEPWLSYVPPQGWFDGSKKSVRDYWKKHARLIEAALLKQEKARANDLKTRNETAEIAYINDVRETVNALEAPMTIDKARELETKFRTTFNYSANAILPEHAQFLLNIPYQGMKEDNEIASELMYRRYTLNEKIEMSDLVGITDPALKTDLIKNLVEAPGGLSKGSESTPGTIAHRNARVTGVVNQYLNRTKTDATRDLVWFANYDQAIKFYDEQYNKYRASGMSEELAAQTALQDTAKQITDTKEVPDPEDETKTIKVPIWDTYKALTKTQVNALQDQAKLAIALNNNRDLINSAEPLTGELPHLKVAAKYLQSFRTGNQAPFPEIYRYLGSRLKIDPMKLMKTRLEATGLVDGDEIFIIEEGKPGARDLVNPTPSRTLRTVYKQLKENNNTDNFEDYQWMISSSIKPEALANGGYLAIKDRNGNYVDGGIEKVLGKSLEEITIGDVWALSASGYSGLGAFDFTQEGLAALLRDTNIPLNTTWGARGQNLLYLARLRQKAQLSQKSTGVVTAYRRLTYIEKENHEKFKRIVGELPPWLDPNTLSNAAAKELFKTLLVLQEQEE